MSSVWSIGANSVQNSIAIGGKLAIVDDSLVFLPHGLERMFDDVFGALKGTPLDVFVMREAPAQGRLIKLSDIASVGKLERELSLAALGAGGLRERLKIVKKDGTEEVFVVNNLQKVIEHIQSQVP